jgi:Holliday junction DNA helicase RuvA
VREDAIRLFGFGSEEERAWFAHLQTIPGVGAKVALGILDAMPPEALVDAIALQDKAAFARANGVGPKLAGRLAQELAAKQGPKGFITGGASGVPRAANGAPVNGARAEAVSALVNLGIDQSSAARAVASAAKQFEADAPAPELIRAALKEVSREGPTPSGPNAPVLRRPRRGQLVLRPNGRCAPPSAVRRTEARHKSRAQRARAVRPRLAPQSIARRGHDRARCRRVRAVRCRASTAHRRCG